MNLLVEQTNYTTVRCWYPLRDLDKTLRSISLLSETRWKNERGEIDESEFT